MVLIVAEAGGLFDDPVGHGTVGVVVEGIHVRGPEGAVRLDAVPVFPDGGGAFGDGIEPAGILPAEHQVPGHVRMTVVREHMENIGRADEAGAELGAVRPDHGGQGVGRLLRILRQAEVDGQHVLRLGPVLREGGAEGGDNPAVQGFIGGNVLAQDPAGLDDQGRGPGVVGAGDEILPGGALVAAGGGVQAEPVGEMRAAGPEAGRCRGVGDVVHPALHGGELIPQHLRIAVGLVDLPGADGGRVAPGGAGFVVRQNIGDHAADAAVRELVRGHVMEPFAEEAFHIIEVGSRADEDLRVAGPAQALVPLGAVRGNVQEVAPLAPDDVGEELIQRLIPGGQPAGAPHVGMDDDGGEILRPGLAGPGKEPDIPEAEEGEPRVPGLEAVPAGVFHLGFGGTVVFVVPVAVFILHLRMVEEDLVPSLRADGEFNVAGDLLAEVDGGVSIGGFEDPPGGDPLGFPDRLALLENQNVFGPAEEADGLPVFGNDPGVAGFPVVDLGVADGAFRPLPVFVRDEGLLCTVGIYGSQGGDEAAGLSLAGPNVRIVKPAGHAGPEPAAAHGDPEVVLSGGQQGGDVVGLNLQAAGVAGPAGGEDEVADAAAVELGLIDAESRDFQRGFGNGLLCREGAAEDRGDVSCIPGDGDPGSGVNDH